MEIFGSIQKSSRGSGAPFFSNCDEVLVKTKHIIAREEVTPEAFCEENLMQLRTKPLQPIRKVASSGNMRVETQEVESWLNFTPP